MNNKCPACNTVMFIDEIKFALDYGECMHCGAELNVANINVELKLVGDDEEDRPRDSEDSRRQTR